MLPIKISWIKERWKKNFFPCLVIAEKERTFSFDSRITFQVFGLFALD